MEFSLLMDKALIAINETIKADHPFDVSSLFEKDEWNNLTQSERTRFRKHFADAVKNEEIPNVFQCEQKSGKAQQYVKLEINPASLETKMCRYFNFKCKVNLSLGLFFFGLGLFVMLLSPVFLEDDGPMAFLFVISISLFGIVFGIRLLYNCWKTYKKGVPLRSKPTEELKLIFYNECKSNDIYDLSSPANQQKAKLIAQKVGCAKYFDIESAATIDALFNDGKHYSIEIAIENRKQKITDWLNALRHKERLKYEELTKYANLTGRAKRSAMLKGEQEELLKSAKKMESSLNSMINSTQAKELDWASQGGFASAIAGDAAGVAVAVNAQMKNNEIRAQNAANMQAVTRLTLHERDTISNYRSAADKLQGPINETSIKLVADTPKETVFERLEIAIKDVNISETGAFTVKASVSLKKQFLIFDEIPAVVDGTISADLYQEGKKIGSALMVLPTYGVGKTATIEGICLGGAKIGVPYRVEFSPHLLWEMEK